MEKGEQVTDEQKQQAHDLLYSCDSREELCERIVTLEDENGLLNGFWTADDTWHTQLPVRPEAIAVRLSDGTVERYERAVE